MKRKDLCMIELEKQDFMEILEVDFLVQMRYLFIRNPRDGFAFQ
jgi:hypothetical protein